MNYLESRLRIVEQWVRDAAQRLADMLARIKRLEDRMASVPGSQGGGGGSGQTVFFANHLTLGAATGTWPSITPSSTTADVYGSLGGALSIVTTGATIYNYLPDPTDNTHRQVLGSNGDGTYSVISQSCSAD